MTLPIARELAQLGIRVVTIAPGIFDTPMLAGHARGSARRRSASRCRSRRAWASRRNTRALVAHIIENAMLNGEAIRLDGAIRMTAR